MEALLGAGPFELRPGGDGRDEDRYGRKLRIVTRDGQSLGAMLVAAGLAREWTGWRRPRCHVEVDGRLEQIRQREARSGCRARTAARRVGKEWFSSGRFRGA